MTKGQQQMNAIAAQQPFLRSCFGRFGRTTAALLMAVCAITSVPSAKAEGTASSLTTPHAVAVMYHRFGESRYPSTNITTAQVQDHLARLKHDGASVLPLTDIVTALEQGTALPDRATAITVDDGYSSVYAVGWPLFRAAGVPWTVFVNSQTVGQSGYMSWDQIRELVRAGVSIGAHSHSHAHFPALSPEQQKADLLTMQEAFQRELGFVPRLFAYPYGEADGPSMALLKDLGYRAAFGQQSGVLSPAENRFYLPRFALNEHYGAAQHVTPRLSALPLPIRAISPEVPLLPVSGPGNPPTITLSLAKDAPPLSRLACYGPSGESLSPRISQDAASGESSVTLTFAKPFAKGRSRINCTLPASNSRWYWWGTQYLVPGAWD